MEDSKPDYEKILSEADIRITAVRLLVIKTLYEQVHGTFSLQDIMAMMPTADNSSIFRTLTLFAEKHLLHMIDDGSGMQKYCVCHCADHDHHHGHIHLTCTECHQTVCLTEVPIPAVPVPEGFKVKEAEYVIKGLCANCAKKLK